MGDEERTLDEAVEAPSEEEVAAPESAATIDAEAPAEPDSSGLRLAPREDESGDEGQLGLPDPDAASPAKKGIAGLFGGSKAPSGIDTEDEAPKWAMPGARSRRQGSGIRAINRILAVAVLLILVFGVLDLFATIRQAPAGFVRIGSPVLAGDASAGGPAELSAGLPVLANLLESFSKRPIVRDLESNGGEATVTVVQTRTKVPDWKLEAQKLDLIGLSRAADGEMEAIVADREGGRMHILKVEQNMVVGESQFKLVRIATDHVAFEKDGDEVIVK
ncbi:MAG: hypothetical protein QGH42_07730 [Kiritimatiellia bacterium]|jgi:hypothetical protein|nr:hypothetical protein [Kiritimatiellia bacterium]MDP6630849.1 hypothetical protein [Kiritimatiellia bacterium]MDP6811272.1 hypothetical protein [Kiritimatiellia bacterium]MDP7024114.1 hypothetical protein [Kiritimatiellia bacterium]